ncbi:AAA family ATPase [Phreatobacter sp. AB_2022a]|uniref:AAA family ATPase n=1 Tax=Phreatobacter sp. AB_2022a TaxID=3003134 RepID=UPI002286FC42|nr:ATP-binding protein [Phreatobacter sp. AB_2022a]MCZ0736573.1 ATP-binding protein [Phreatobacter sp. AB_2022a]
MATLHLICGLPGSGKSTLARRLETAGEGIRFSPDEWLLALGSSLHDETMRERVEQLQWALGQQLLAGGVSVILENGFWSRAERDAYRSAAAAHGATTRLHYLAAPIEELKRRVAARNRDAPSGATIDPEDLDSWAALFEPPGDEEIRR